MLYNRWILIANYSVINVMKKLLPLILLIVTAFLSVQVMADAMADMEKMSSDLKQVNKKLSRGQFEGDDLAAWTKLTIKMKSSASLCVSNSEAALLDLKSITDGLGEAVKGEDAEVTKKREVYEKEKEELEKTLAIDGSRCAKAGEKAVDKSWYGDQLKAAKR